MKIRVMQRRGIIKRVVVCTTSRRCTMFNIIKIIIRKCGGAGDAHFRSFGHRLLVTASFFGVLFVVFVLTDCRCFDRWVIVLLIVVISGFLADLMLSFAID